MSTNNILPTFGYFLISTSSVLEGRLIVSNNERAFVISQLQDILGMRSLLEDPYTNKRLSAHIDLLAYSISPQTIQLLVFAISRRSARSLAALLGERLRQYQSEYTAIGHAHDTTYTIKRLFGQHQALSTSIAIHCRHSDWEYDRYSSIGFYLHDRRGDWMRPWRLSRLYENDTEVYRLLLQNELQKYASFDSTKARTIGS